MVKIFDNKFAFSTYDEDYKLLTITWKDKSFTFEEYKDVFIEGLDYHLKSGVTVDNFLSDIRIQKVVPPHFRKWFQQVAIKRAISQGLKRGSVVMSGNVFKKYYINHIFNTTKTYGLPLKAFSSVDKAKEWFGSFEK